jgi:hypothetical protein
MAAFLALEKSLEDGRVTLGHTLASYHLLQTWSSPTQASMQTSPVSLDKEGWVQYMTVSL